MSLSRIHKYLPAENISTFGLDIFSGQRADMYSNFEYTINYGICSCMQRHTQGHFNTKLSLLHFFRRFFSDFSQAFSQSFEEELELLISLSLQTIDGELVGGMMVGYCEGDTAVGRAVTVGELDGKLLGRYILGRCV